MNTMEKLYLSELDKLVEDNTTNQEELALQYEKVARVL